MIGLLSLRTLDGAQSARIWLATEATDMRCGFDRLAERVRAVIGRMLSVDVLRLSGWLNGDVKESRNDNPTSDLQMAADRIRSHPLCRVDETYVRVKGRWCYLSRAIDSAGATIDFLLSALRDGDAAKRLFRKALGHQSILNLE
jgi:hypothetical protein